MFALCHFKSNPSDKFVLFDKDEFTTEEMGIDIEENLTLNQYTLFDKKECNNLPLLNYTDLLIRILNSKTKTITHSLSLLKIVSLNDLLRQVDLIEAKISDLSHSQRKTVLEQYDLVIKSNKTEQQSE